MRSRLIEPLLKDEMPKIAGIIQKLRLGPLSKPKWWRWPLRMIRDIVVSFKEGIQRRSIFPISYKRRIISMTIDSLATQYAKETDKKVFYKRLDTLFKPPL